MKLWIGTSGYSYKEWCGSFYPEGLAATAMLEHYAKQLQSVELNHTFYRMPKREAVLRWRQEVPADFRFVIKASRRLTHLSRLRERGETLQFFTNSVAALEDQYGAVLLQLPPNMKQDTSRLQQFLAAWPRELPAAFEFRHPSWQNSETLAVLQDHGCGLVLSDDSGRDWQSLPGTTPFGYLRLRQPHYQDQELLEILAFIRSQSWPQAFVFFKHEDDGASPQMAKTLLRLAEPTKRRWAKSSPGEPPSQRDTG